MSEGGVRRVLLLIAGSLFLVAGAIGVVLPVIPTTPFLIVAAFCYARSSDRCYRWLLSNRVFGRHLEDYLAGRGIPFKIKAFALALLWAAISVSAFVVVKQWWLRALLLAIAVGVSSHILLLKGRRREPE